MSRGRGCPAADILPRSPWAMGPRGSARPRVPDSQGPFRSSISAPPTSKGATPSRSLGGPGRRLGGEGRSIVDSCLLGFIEISLQSLPIGDVSHSQSGGGLAILLGTLGRTPVFRIRDRRNSVAATSIGLSPRSTLSPSRIAAASCLSPRSSVQDVLVHAFQGLRARLEAGSSHSSHAWPIARRQKKSRSEFKLSAKFSEWRISENSLRWWLNDCSTLKAEGPLRRSRR